MGLAYSYKQLYGKEIAVRFVEKKLSEAKSDEIKKQNLTALLAELKK